MLQIQHIIRFGSSVPWAVSVCVIEERYRRMRVTLLLVIVLFSQISRSDDSAGNNDDHVIEREEKLLAILLARDHGAGKGQFDGKFNF